MVIDSLSACAKYTSLNPHFAKAFYFLATNDLNTIAPGKYTIDGENVFANIVEAPLKTAEVAKMEVHNNYLDIQICIKGKETFGWIKREACNKPIDEYNPEKDILFLEDKATTFFTLNEGEFAIFFPEDGHQPMIGEGNIRKCIIKVRV